MSFNKCTNKNYYVDGRSFVGYAEGTGIALTRQGYSQEGFSSGVWNGRIDSGMPSWSNGTGTPIDTNGTVIFNNDAHGCALSTMLVANRGSNTAYIGFNSSTPSLASGFPLASGESKQWDNTFITEMWAITFAGTTAINAQGMPVTNQRQTFI